MRNLDQKKEKTVCYDKRARGGRTIDYNKSIQTSIAYIESHLQDPISVADVAKKAGYSPYHFHRVFLQEVGLSLSEYIKRRRLCFAAKTLLHTDTPVIEVAFSCGFESQEAFTRAFKRLYGLPPARYRTRFQPHQFIQANGGNMMDLQTSPIKHWFLSGSQPAEYEYGLDTETVHQGSVSAYLKSYALQEEDDFATLMQQFNAKNYVGKRVRFSGFVKTKNVTNYCGLWMRVDNNMNDALQFDNMSNRKIEGTTNWNRYAIVLDVPENSAVISFGLLLSGKGQAWLDSCSFEVVDKKVPSTNIEMNFTMYDEPLNLSFQE